MSNTMGESEGPGRRTQNLANAIREAMHSRAPDARSSVGGAFGAGERLADRVMTQTGVLGLISVALIAALVWGAIHIGKTTLEQHSHANASLTGLVTQNTRLINELKTVAKQLDRLGDQLTIANQINLRSRGDDSYRMRPPPAKEQAR